MLFECAPYVPPPPSAQLLRRPWPFQLYVYPPLMHIDSIVIIVGSLDAAWCFA